MTDLLQNLSIILLAYAIIKMKRELKIKDAQLEER